MSSYGIGTVLHLRCTETQLVAFRVTCKTERSNCCYGKYTPSYQKETKSQFIVKMTWQDIVTLYTFLVYKYFCADMLKPLEILKVNHHRETDMDLIYQKEQTIPGSIQYSIKRYYTPNFIDSRRYRYDGISLPRKPPGKIIWNFATAAPATDIAKKKVATDVHRIAHR